MAPNNRDIPVHCTRLSILMYFFIYVAAVVYQWRCFPWSIAIASIEDWHYLSRRDCDFCSLFLFLALKQPIIPEHSYVNRVQSTWHDLSRLSFNCAIYAFVIKLDTNSRSTALFFFLREQSFVLMCIWTFWRLKARQRYCFTRPTSNN